MPDNQTLSPADAAKANTLAEHISNRAEAALIPLAAEIAAWPAPFRAIVWHSVGLVAQRHEAVAENDHG